MILPPSNPTLADWLNFLEQLNPYYIELGLDRVAKVARALKLTVFPCPVVTVTGTNGKGSCVTFLESIWRCGNYRVGAYLSPHLFRFNERIRVNGAEIQDEVLCAAFNAIYMAKAETALTYFEFTTLAAFYIFQRANLDVLVLEVGLGGRLDAVNIVDADIALISTIGLDHCDWLGNTREEIAFEKAGIFRSRKPAICGDFSPPDSIFAVAQELSAPLYCINKDFFYDADSEKWTWRFGKESYSALPKPILELQNVATSMMAIHLLQSRLPVSKIQIARGIEQAYLPGRWQKITRDVEHIFDVAHNPAAATWLAQKLMREPCRGRTLAVVGMLKDKDIAGTLKVFLDVIDEWHVGSLHNPRAASGTQLKQALQDFGIKKCYDEASIVEAYLQAKKACGPQDRIVIFGSFYTVAKIQELNLSEGRLS